METRTSNVEMLDKFIDNERKSRMWTIISVSLFLLMAALVLVFAFKLKSTNEKLDVTQSELEIAYAKQDSLISVLQQRALSTDRNSDDLASQYDSLKQAFDVMALLFNKSQEQYFNNNEAAAKEGISKISDKIIPKKDEKVLEKVKAAIMRPASIQKTVGDFLVFVQYMPGFEDETKAIIPVLRAKRYKVQPQQLINDFTFNSGVKYFYEDDKAEAQKIVTMINNSDDYFKKHPAAIQKSNLKSPYHQVEVWIGEYKTRDARLFLKQVQTRKLTKTN